MEKELNVLLVDDDEDEYVLLKDMFARLPGRKRAVRYRLEWAATYEKALERCQAGGYDVHLVDYHLGRYNGLEFLRVARENGSDAASILLTGQENYELDLAAMQQGVYDYLVKDQVNEYTLERTIRYALERRQAEEELERRVQARTGELAAANERLAEINRELSGEITRRIWAEQVLRESETRFRALADTTSAAIFIVQDDLVRYANPATRYVTGYLPEEVIGIELWRLAHPAYQSAMRETRMVSHWAPEIPARYEMKILHKDGGERWVDLTAGKLDYGGREAYLYTAFDITERDMAEKALRRARDLLEERVAQRTREIGMAHQRLQAVLSTLPVGILVAGAAGQVIDSNHALAALWGATDALPENLKDWPALDARLPDTGERVTLRDWLIERTVKNGEAILGQMLDIQTQAGQQRTVLYSSTPIMGAEVGDFAPGAAAAGGVAVLQDITQQRALEQQARTAAYEAQQRAEALDGLHRATATLLTTLDLDQLLCQILDAAQSAIPAGEKGLLHLVSPADGQLQARAALGFSDKRICVVNTGENRSLPAFVARERRPLLLEDAGCVDASDPGCEIPPEMRGSQSIILAPLYYGDQVFGTISLSSDRPGAFSESNLRLLASFAATTTAALQNAILHAEIKHLADTDPLTGEYNRRVFFELGRRELERSRHMNQPLAAVMIDLDRFKSINDRFGHVAGDQALRRLAERVKASIRETDIFGRYGGDEFALLLPDTGLASAVRIAERIRDAVHCAPWSFDDGQAAMVSVSLGIAFAGPAHRVLEDLLSDADQALYMAKARGRNRVEVLDGQERGA